jgi:hypothetical protein
VSTLFDTAGKARHAGLTRSFSRTGVKKNPIPILDFSSDNPFAGERQSVNPFERATDKPKAESPTSPSRHASTDEWGKSSLHIISEKLPGEHGTNERTDAAKTPPSRFQQRKGSVYATPNSRDGHVDKNSARDAKFHELVDKKYSTSSGGKRRHSSSKGGEKPEM